MKTLVSLVALVPLVRLVSLVSLVSLVAPVPLLAQRACEEPQLGFDPHFSCIPRRIDAASGGSIISGCAEEIRLCVGKPLAPQHADAPDGSPVRLYRVLGDPADDLFLVDHMVHWYPDTATGSIVVVPDPPLVITDGDPTRPVVYRLVTDCRFWRGPDHEGVDTSYIDLWKQHVVRVQGAAHRLHDGARIAEEVVVSPGPAVATGFVANGVVLEAEDSERYRFDHWSCSVDLSGLDPRAPAQHLTNTCWPLEDTVVFTAWYRDRTAHVDAAPGTGVVATLMDGHLKITSASQPVNTVAVSDLQGRLHLWREIASGADPISIPFAAPPGIYVVVVRGNASTTTLPLLHSP